MSQQPAICRLAVVPVRKEPSDTSEMVTQLLFGESAQILESGEKWHMVRADHDLYEGWVDRKQLVPGSGEPVKGYLSSAAIISASPPLPLWLPAGSVLRAGDAFDPGQGDVPSAEHAARMFLGAPYLWGGRTALGIDCSGLTQLAFRLAGKQLPRDAWQQAMEGDLIPFADEARTDDLAFFDNAEGRIVHVGIVCRGTEGGLSILHASGQVREDQLDHQGIYHRGLQQYTHSLRMIRRIR